jgi:Rrf2 family transcriptional regulator, nitric oxide-sensitive transcriptional repressor
LSEGAPTQAGSRFNMRLTTFTDYGLRVLIYLAAERRRRATIGEIAASFDISQSHLTKVVHLLGRKGWLATVRGKGGGIELGMTPGDIVVGQVVRAMEGELQAAECFGTGECSIARVCRLRGVLAEAADAFHAVLDRCTLADLVADDAALATVMFKDRSAGGLTMGVQP